MEEDYYALLGLSPDEPNFEKRLKKINRTFALKYHPDKNPDNPHAAEMFMKYQKIYQILLDPKAKAAYDSLWKARAARKRKNEEQDASRKKLRETLEEREARSGEGRAQEREAEIRLQKEIDRLRAEGRMRAAEMSRQIGSSAKDVLTTTPTTAATPPTTQAAPANPFASIPLSRDYEDVTIMRMRQQAARKKLIEETLAREAEEI
eukprot:GILJ01007617.1.p1 GENE.GILJ01007617.1~~GILJ01007617.1.p1  ORF type:complete len:227 (-),score=37.88 GILJ01007617.1:112-729(-)